MPDREGHFEEREQGSYPYNWQRISVDSAVVKNCLTLGGKLLNQPEPNERRKTGFSPPLGPDA